MLNQVVERFAGMIQAVSEADLGRPWAWGEYNSEGVRFAIFRTYEELRELAVKIAYERMSSGLPMSSVQHILAQYHRAHRHLQAVLLGVDSGLYEKSPAQGEWSVRRALGHIVGADAGFYIVVSYALERCRSGDDHPTPIPDEAWPRLLVMDEAAFETILAGPLTGLQSYHQGLHDRVLELFASISEAELAWDSLYWEGNPFPLRFRLGRFDSHQRQHTIQIEKTLTVLGHPHTEARRLLQLVYDALGEAEAASLGAGTVGAALYQSSAEAITRRTEEIVEALK